MDIVCGPLPSRRRFRREIEALFNARTNSADTSGEAARSHVNIPTLRATIDRRVLVNFRIDPAAIERILPLPFKPQLVDGYAIAGICLIRLVKIRPAFLPVPIGFRSENAAHRIAVELPDGSSGVYIPRRDTDSRLNVLVGGRLFPGEHHRASFTSYETVELFNVEMRSNDGETVVEVKSRIAEELPASSIFANVATVSDFFENGSIGYSGTGDGASFDTLELATTEWDVQPLRVDYVASSFFDDWNVFPPGSVEFDNALLMRDIDHEWHAREPLYCDE